MLSTVPSKPLIDTWWPAIGNGIEAIISTASGCGVTVKDYAHLMRDDPEYADKAERISSLTFDLAELIAAETAESVLEPELAQNLRVAFHSPCTLQHGQKVVGLIETLLLFLLVMGGLFLGFFTPTEAGAVGAFGSILIALFRRNLTWKGFVQSLFETTRISCMILVIVAGATIFGHFLAITRIPFDIAEWVTSFNLPDYMIMGMIILEAVMLTTIAGVLGMMAGIWLIEALDLSVDFYAMEARAHGLSKAPADARSLREAIQAGPPMIGVLEDVLLHQRLRESHVGRPLHLTLDDHGVQGTTAVVGHPDLSEIDGSGIIVGVVVNRVQVVPVVEVAVDLEAVADISRPRAGVEAVVVLVVEPRAGRRGFLQNAAEVVFTRPADVRRPLRVRSGAGQKDGDEHPCFNYRFHYELQN